MSTPAPATVSTHVLDTSDGRPAEGVAVRFFARAAHESAWRDLGGSVTDADGRCRDLPRPPEDTAHARLEFLVEPYLAATGRPVFFPEVTVTFAVTPGEHYHVPLLLNPFGYSVYRGS